MKKNTKFCIISVVMMYLNCIILGMMEELIGGNATNGKIEAGVCYVVNAEGVITEVTKPVFIFSYVFTCVTALSIVVGFFSVIILGVIAANNPIRRKEKK